MAHLDAALGDESVGFVSEMQLNRPGSPRRSPYRCYKTPLKSLGEDGEGLFICQQNIYPSVLNKRSSPEGLSTFLENHFPMGIFMVKSAVGRGLV